MSLARKPEATLTVTVTNANDEPIAVPDEVTGSENQVLGHRCAGK